VGRVGLVDISAGCSEATDAETTELTSTPWIVIELKATESKKTASETTEPEAIDAEVTPLDTTEAAAELDAIGNLEATFETDVKGKSEVTGNLEVVGGSNAPGSEGKKALETSGLHALEGPKATAGIEVVEGPDSAEKPAPRGIPETLGSRISGTEARRLLAMSIRDETCKARVIGFEGLGGVAKLAVAMTCLPAVGAKAIGAEIERSDVSANGDWTIVVSWDVVGLRKIRENERLRSTRDAAGVVILESRAVDATD
jgi:hypothetical protein